MEYEKWIEKGIELGTEYGLKVLGAIIIWIVGSWTIKKNGQTNRKSIE